FARAAAALLLLVAPLLAGAAAGADDADVLEMSIEELLDLEVVTASKKKQSMAEAPAFTHVITREQILRYGYRTVGEALSSLIGLYSSTDLVYGYTGVRGFGRAGDYNTRILVLFDGQRINDPLYDYGALDESLPIDIDGVERIEVVKGPGSALWGSNALLAVVNVVPQRGADVDGVEGGVEYASYDRFKGYIQGGGEIAGVDGAAMFSHVSGDGDDEIEIPGLGSAEDQDYGASSQGYFTASYRGFKLNFLAGGGEKRDPTGANYVIFNSPFDGTWYESTRYQTQLSYERGVLPERKGNVMARFYHSVYDRHTDYEYDSLTLFPDVDPYVNHDEGESQAWGGELQVSGELHRRVALIGGFEYHDVYKAHFKNVDQFALHLDEELDWRIFAGYAQAEIEAASFLRLILGGRVDDYSNLAAKWSPRAALVVTPVEGTAVKALFGQAFRAPNAYERVYDNGGLLGRTLGGRRGPPGARRLSILGNPDLEPETITTWEVIWDQALGGNLRLVTSLYQYEIEDIISPIDVSTGVLQYQNLGTVESRGAEVMLQARLENGILGHVGFSVLRAEDADTGSRIENSPKYLGNLAVSVPLFAQKLTLSGELQAVGGRKTLSDTEVGASFNTNLILRYKPFKWADATFGIYNLVGEDQWVPSALQHLNNGTDELPLRGRAFRGVIRGRY
ncbi:MAG TPA: TonB-dependent receptor, partial [Myxococcota bacterium]